MPPMGGGAVAGELLEHVVPLDVEPGRGELRAPAVEVRLEADLPLPGVGQVEVAVGVDEKDVGVHRVLRVAVLPVGDEAAPEVDDGAGPPAPPPERALEPPALGLVRRVQVDALEVHRLVAQRPRHPHAARQGQGVLDEEGARVDGGRRDAAQLPRSVDARLRVQQIDAVAGHLRHVDPEPARPLEVQRGRLEPDRHPVLAARGRGAHVEEHAVADEPLVVVEPEVAVVPLHLAHPPAHVDHGRAIGEAVAVLPVAVRPEPVRGVAQGDGVVQADLDVGAQQELPRVVHRVAHVVVEKAGPGVDALAGRRRDDVERLDDVGDGQQRRPEVRANIVVEEGRS